MEYTVIHGNNYVSQYNSIDGVRRDIKDPCLIVNKVGHVTLLNGINPIKWPVPTEIGTQAIVNIRNGSLRFGKYEVTSLFEFAVSTYGDSGTVPKPALKEFTSIEDVQPAIHIFDIIDCWPKQSGLYAGTKKLPLAWSWRWIEDDWVLSKETEILTRNDWEEYKNKTVSAQPLGTKADDGKVMMGAMPPHAELAVARVLTFGAKKYSRGNWAHVENSDERYMDAALRHINTYRRGEQTDSETGENHLSHAICCLMFILDKSESK